MVHFNHTLSTAEFNLSLDQFLQSVALKFKEFQESTGKKISHFIIRTSLFVNTSPPLIKNKFSFTNTCDKWVEVIEPNKEGDKITQNAEPDFTRVHDRIKRLYSHVQPDLNYPHELKVQITPRSKDNGTDQGLVLEPGCYATSNNGIISIKPFEKYNFQYGSDKKRIDCSAATRGQISAPNQGPAEMIKSNL